jgi:acetyl-CoA carboxylase carboxyl transferase subunit alpha
MDLKFLDFEQPIAELEAQIESLNFVGDDSRSTSAKSSAASRRRARR